LEARIIVLRNRHLALAQAAANIDAYQLAEKFGGAQSSPVPHEVLNVWSAFLLPCPLKCLTDFLPGARLVQV
jgi:hypothetical protein